MSPDAPHVLFVCVHNAGRSQMAQAFAERHGSPGIVAESAGSDPAAAIWPTVVEAMAEVGIDLSDRRPARLDADAQRRGALAVTMGCGDACPYVPGPVEDWEVADPAGRSLAEVRAIRDDVEARVLELLRRRFGRSGADPRAAERA